MANEKPNTAVEDLEMDVGNDIDVEIEGAGDPAEGDADTQAIIADLQKRLADKDSETAEADRLRRAAEDQVGTLSKTANSERLGRLEAMEEATDNAILGKQGDLADIKRKMKDAFESGDSETYIDLQEKMGEIQLNLKELDYSKRQIEAAKTKKPEPEKKPASDVGEITKKSQEWIDDHPEFDNDPVFRATAIAGHNKALKAGIVIDSKKYFSFLDDYMERHMADDDEPVQKEPRAERELIQAAPPARGNAGAADGAGGKRVVKLTNEQKEMADIMEMSYPDYYRYLEEENKKGARK